MEIIIPLICLLIIGLVIVFIVTSKQKNNDSNNSLTVIENETIVTDTQDLIVKFEELSIATKIDETQLVEIKDSALIQRFVDLVPNANQVLNNIKDSKQIKETIETGEKLYKAVIPKGAILDNSKNMKGAVRGSFRGFDKANRGRISGDANWVPVDVDELTNKMAHTNMANAGYNLAAAVVGQHYMAEIDKKLKILTDDIEKISSFQENKYKSKVCALIAEIQTVSQFQLNIIENDEERKAKINHLQQLRYDCTTLLGQANSTIQEIIAKPSSEYKNYEKDILSANSWYKYQNILFELLYRISELDHTLHLGTLSKEQCYSICSTYTKQVQNTQTQLQEWHQSHEEKFAIDIANAKRKRLGFEGLVFKLPGLIDDKWNYKNVSESTIEMIENQSSSILQNTNSIDLFQEDVQVITKQGKLYYLPQ